MRLVFVSTIVFLLTLLTYTLVGTSGNIEKIKELAPKNMEQRNWKILRYEGFQHGSWSTHGGTCWYHVANIDNPNIQYRVEIALWNGELQYYYNAPEVLERIEIKR